MFIATATASLLPYLTIHMQSIGLTVDEISMVYLALPLTTFLSPPITGMYNQLTAFRFIIIYLAWFPYQSKVGLWYQVCVCPHLLTFEINYGFS